MPSQVERIKAKAETVCAECLSDAYDGRHDPDCYYDGMYYDDEELEVTYALQVRVPSAGTYEVRRVSG